MYTVELVRLIEKLNLENCTPDIDIKCIKISQPDVNRPALQLAGFFDHFDSERVQVIGHVEMAYMQQMDSEQRVQIFTRLMDFRVPCIVFSRNMEVSEKFIQMATQKGVPILRTSKTTSSFMAEVIRWLNVELAPRITIHGGLVDVYGEGILIMGESGIGKSEAALELIKRGHRLVADDAVEIKKVSDDTLIGTSPDISDISSNFEVSELLMSKPCSVLKVLKTHRLSIWSLSWRNGIGINSMTVLVWKRNI
jgi:HPr kinase/phosphorylase